MANLRTWKQRKVRARGIAAERFARRLRQGKIKKNPMVKAVKGEG